MRQFASATKSVSRVKSTGKQVESYDAKSSRSAAAASIQFDSVAIQPKLKVSQPNDPYEQEADKVAEQIMRMSASQSASPQLRGEHPIVSRKCTTCGMNKEEKEEEKLEISRKPSGSTKLETRDIITNEINGIRSSTGSPLDANTREFVESHLGYDFSKVRIHTGALATRSAQSVNALAYTVGNDIVFAEDRYRPDTYDGRKLIAHELIHTIQQGIVNIQMIDTGNTNLAQVTGSELGKDRSYNVSRLLTKENRNM